MSPATQSESFETLMDEVSSIVPLLAEAEDVLTNNKESLAERRHSILQDLEQATGKLSEWRRSFRQGSICYWAVPSTAHNRVDDTNSGKLFPFAIKFESLDTATSLILYSAVKLEVCRTIKCLERTVRVSKTSIMEDQESHEIARFLCQSIEYCFRPEMGILGPQMTCLAQWAMRRYFSRNGCDKELAWCINISNMQGLDFRSGVNLMLFGMGSEY
jgi:hypothetical protein